MFLKVSKNKGMSLIEVLVSLGIMSIVLLATSMISINQYREIKALNEKISTLDLEKLLIPALGNGKVCKYVLNNPTSLTFDSTTLPQTINLSTLNPARSLYSSMIDATTPGGILLAKDQLASSLTSTLFVKTIKLNIISGSGMIYIGNWEIEFDNTKTIRPLKPVYVSTTLTVDTTTATAAKITNCQSTEDALDIVLTTSDVGGGSNTITLGDYKTCLLSEIAFTRDGDSQITQSARVYRTGTTWYAERSTGGGSELVKVGVTCFN